MLDNKQIYKLFNLIQANVNNKHIKIDEKVKKITLNIFTIISQI